MRILITRLGRSRPLFSSPRGAHPVGERKLRRLDDSGHRRHQLPFGVWRGGGVTIPGGSCADTELGVMGSASAPLSDSETTFVLNETHCGASAQVIDMDTCEVSAVVVLPTENAYDMGYDDGYDDGYLEGESSVDITSDNADVYDHGYADGLAECDTSEEPADCASDDSEWYIAVSTTDVLGDIYHSLNPKQCEALGFTPVDEGGWFACEAPDDFDGISPAICAALGYAAFCLDEGGY